MKFLEKYTDIICAILRIMTGFMFTFHGLQKVFGILAVRQPPMFSQLWIGGVVEVICGPLIVIGLQSRWAAFVASGTMAVAYFQFHWKFQFGPEFFPVINGGDAAILYCFVFLYIACHGSGIWSLDKS